MKAAIVLLLAFVAVATAQVWSSKVTRELQDKFKTESTPNLLVILSDDVTPMEFVKKFKNVEERTHFILAEKLNARSSQKGIIEYLKAKKLAYKSFYIQNLIAVEGATKEVVQWLAAHPKVQSITIDFSIFMDAPIPATQSSESERTRHFFNGKEFAWHIAQTGADQVWAEGFTGKGSVVSLIDTGINAKHGLLINQFRGLKPDGSLDHQFNWLDPGKQCPKGVLCDTQGHGSHCTGIMAGQNDSYITGLSPDSKFIGCAGLSGKFMSSLIECFEFMLAPWGDDRDDIRPELRPHVVSNSYRCSDTIDHCSIIVKELTKTLEAVGVAVMFSAGNSGPGCQTLTKNMTSPLLVAALKEKSNVVTSFSSRGPMILPDGTKVPKPDIAAPGENVISVAARTPSGVVKMSGTSMASPQVGGAIALLWSAVPKLNREVAKTFEILKKSALEVKSTDCGATSTPNNVYGHGVMRIHEAYKLAKEMEARGEL